MLTGFAPGEFVLEERAARSGNRRLRGRFPYNRKTVLSSGGRRGRPRKEQFAPRAFAYNVEKPEVDIRLLVGHNWGAPLASRKTGTLELQDGDEALTFVAIITPEVQETSWARDALAGLAAGLIVGLSPGFTIPPERAVPKAEEITEEPDDGSPDEDGQPQHGAIIRTILAALLWELSLVTAAAYSEAEVEARDWTPTPSGLVVPKSQALRRWRL
ncbi:HK97 family phage prohead protease [Chelativorans intermedius]|uniref:HK97 family phage prohead protease n=1 Tax=Chelativorans intermedius TaxID=515947 RepID=A0ABV6D9Q5_9HYPH|nr:HK97 family phage prohead protease [Chelativorans intermedius]MCT8999117.1 HK97 family phage prohead protease [Chelativorans intermedius]